MGDAAAVGTMGSSPLARGLPPRTPRPGSTPGIIPARAGFTEQLVHDGQYRGDHPRSRGVYPPRRVSRIRRPGSSPLARGLQHGRTESGDWAGIIPARAGFTGWVAGRWAPPRDHPRSRGVYDDLVDVRTMTVGSSPLARGLRRIRLTALMGLRIIPARAGFTLLFCVTGCWGPGSSPLARGLPDPEALSSGVTRIIPARAGFTAITDAFKGFLEDHPRSRGVYAMDRVPALIVGWIIPARAGFTSWTTGATTIASGSSPLARGLRIRLGRAGGHDRIIPARAGFTGCRRSDRPQDRGSSPLARGLLDGEQVGVGDAGIIPARAGFTDLISGQFMSLTDHPRSRGVYAAPPHRPAGSAGSSPLARGLRSSDHGGLHSWWDHPRSRGVY